MRHLDFRQQSDLDGGQSVPSPQSHLAAMQQADDDARDAAAERIRDDWRTARIGTTEAIARLQVLADATHPRASLYIETDRDETAAGYALAHAIIAATSRRQE